MEFIDIVKKMEQENKESEKIISLLKIVSDLVDENAKLKYRITEPELLEHRREILQKRKQAYAERPEEFKKSVRFQKKKKLLASVEKRVEGVQNEI